ncbi:hypothetical protein HYN69_14080 [Gemmobacter aquarius]|uniref:Uncharacterized protein n=1 Tax=Paragemmobacter aquarius TaxID=2169400 RepID=A0A2S0UNV4_9RHOB|nr:hypothetical protein HYN69_14080 [Gemmobacter aquarius]
MGGASRLPARPPFAPESASLPPPPQTDRYDQRHQVGEILRRPSCRAGHAIDAAVTLPRQRMPFSLCFRRDEPLCLRLRSGPQGG